MEQPERGTGLNRRDLIKKSVAGAAAAGVVWSAPRIEGLSLRPSYAAASSTGGTADTVIVFATMSAGPVGWSAPAGATTATGDAQGVDTSIDIKLANSLITFNEANIVGGAGSIGFVDPKGVDGFVDSFPFHVRVTFNCT